MNVASLLSAIVESSDDAIVGKSLDSTVLSWNQAAERIFGYAADEMIGSSIRRIIPSDRQAEEDAILETIRSGRRVPTFETIRVRKDGTEVCVAVTVSPVHDGEGRVVAASKIARDITEKQRIRRQAAEVEARFRLLADNISQLAWMADGAGSLIWYNQRWYDYTGTSPEQVEGWGWEMVQHPDHRARVVDRWKHHLASGEVWEDTFPLRGADGEYRWFLSRAIPGRDENGAIALWFGTNTDITDRLDAERRIEQLMMEVNHRSKNMLAVIQSLARRSAAQGGDFIDRLEARIAALSANQDLVVQRSWRSVGVRDMVRAQLVFLEAAAGQVRCEGPDIAIAPPAAEAISMAIHEMATNALKYGALASPEGAVEIVWGIENRGLPIPSFFIRWVESGGPPCVPPAETGLGSTIIADVPRMKLRGEIALEYPRQGFRWELSCPVENVLPSLTEPGSSFAKAADRTLRGEAGRDLS
ncbi:MAG: PAS domain S-box protein [Novosphingobium sp.]|nr:PAS domain S-box protein [Novosphingobium sp.]